MPNTVWRALVMNSNLVCLFFLLLCVGLPVRAESNAHSPVFSAPDWEISAGPGVLVGPRYPGAATVRALPIPALDARNGAIFFNGRDGLGVDIVDTGGFRSGAAIFLEFGRKQSDDRKRLSGLPDIDPAPQARLFAEQSWGPFRVHAMAARSLGSGNGTTLSLDATMSASLGNGIRLTAGPQAAFGDGRFIRTYFGIAPGGARPAYAVGSGLYQAGVGAGLFTRVGQRWALGGTISANWLQGPVARSPVVGARGQFSGGLFLTYAFMTADPGDGGARYRQ